MYFTISFLSRDAMHKRGLCQGVGMSVCPSRSYILSEK